MKSRYPSHTHTNTHTPFTHTQPLHIHARNFYTHNSAHTQTHTHTSLHRQLHTPTHTYIYTQTNPLGFKTYPNKKHLKAHQQHCTHDVTKAITLERSLVSRIFIVKLSSALEVHTRQQLRPTQPNNYTENTSPTLWKEDARHAFSLRLLCTFRQIPLKHSGINAANKRT